MTQCLYNLSEHRQELELEEHRCPHIRINACHWQWATRALSSPSNWKNFEVPVYNLELQVRRAKYTPDQNYQPLTGSDLPPFPNPASFFDIRPCTLPSSGAIGLLSPAL